MPNTLLVLIALALLASQPIGAQVEVLTANYGNARTNANLNETTLNVFNVNATQFGKLFSLPVTGFINSQPLYARKVAIPGQGTHNVLYVTTMHNDVYAFDADAAGGSLWHVNLGPSVPNADFNVDDLTEVGILGTPVIDRDSQTIYVVAFTKENGDYIYRLHALDMTTGDEKFSGPGVISAAVPGTNPRDVQNGMVPFVPSLHLQRPGLALLNNTVYIGFGSHTDSGVFHGWLLGYNASNVQQQVSAFLTTPNGYGSAIWQGGRAPAIDENGMIYVATGNGPAVTKENYGESVLKLDPSSGSLSLADWFTPDNWVQLNALDSDLGSSGPVLTSSGTVIQGGKEGVIFLMDVNHLGHEQTGNGQIRQSFQAIGYGIFNLAFWERPDVSFLYMRAYNDAVKGFRLINGRFETSPFTQTKLKSGLYFDGMAISGNGASANFGILWLTTSPDGDHDGAGVLHAFVARDLSQELWNSELNPGQDRLGQLAKFTEPTVANGKVYVPTFSGQLVVYGLKSQTNMVADVVNAASGLSGAVSPGEMVVVYGSGLGPADLADAQLDSTGGLATSLGGAKMLIEGVEAPLIYSRSDQVAAIVPFGVAGQSSVTFESEYQGQKLVAFSVPVADTRPGLFTANDTGIGQGAILNQDTSLNSASNPAARGSIVVLYGTGQGATDPAWKENQLASNPLPKPLGSVTVKIAGQEAEILYSGAAPGMAGVMQFNVRVPTNIKPGNFVPVMVYIGDGRSQSGVTLAVQ